MSHITDDQLAEIERFLAFGGSTLKLRTEPLRGLIARLRAAEKDAARFRHLMFNNVEWVSGEMTRLVFGPFPAQKLRKTIDTAMEQQP